MVAVLSREKPLCGALIQKDRSPWPWPSRPYLPWLSTASSVLFPHVLETFWAFEAPSYTFSPPNLIASIRRENFSLWYSLHFSRREICDSPLPDGTLQRLGHLSCFFFFFSKNVWVVTFTCNCVQVELVTEIQSWMCCSSTCFFFLFEGG